jgi:type I restriction enzyme, R subunit
VSPRRFSESELVERPALDLLGELGWTVVDAYAETLGPAGTLGRDSIHDVVLAHRLRDALRWLNPSVPDLVREEALTAVTKDRSGMDRTRANREIYHLLRDGYQAEWRDDRGELCLGTVSYLDFNDSTKNDWLAASQVWIAGDLYRRRADTILFVNGLPLVLAEFNWPSSKSRTGRCRRRSMRT